MRSFQLSDEDLYAALAPTLRPLATRGITQSYRKNSVLLNEGEEGSNLFVLLKGSVKFFATSASGREMTYGTIDAGDYFGVMSLDGGPRSASVMTLEPCLCAVLSHATVSEYLREEPAFAFDLVMHVIRRARAATETARSMALLDVYGRLLALLDERRGNVAGEDIVTLQALTHQDIANRVGASREMVSRLLKELEKNGYIKLGVRQITLLKKLPDRW
jgi:CRP/FNR family cyclic AMP-dependent transcriptional regulator